MRRELMGAVKGCNEMDDLIQQLIWSGADDNVCFLAMAGRNALPGFHCALLAPFSFHWFARVVKLLYMIPDIKMGDWRFWTYY